MGRGSRGSGHQIARRPVDLTGILSLAEKNDFVTLVSAITERMLKDVSSIFDTPPVRPVCGEYEQWHWLSLPLQQNGDNDNSDNKENMTTPNSPYRNSQESSSMMYDKAQPAIEQQEKEERVSQLPELKKEVLAFFKKWQGNVLQRFKEINVNDGAAGAPGYRGRGRSARGGYRAPRGGRGGRGGSGALTLAAGPLRTPSNHVDPELVTRHPPLPNPLWALSEGRRKLLLHIALLILLSLQDYNANSRLLLVKLASSLNLPFGIYQDDETRLARGLARAALEVPPEDDATKPDEPKAPRKWKLGLSSGTGTSCPNNLAAALRNVGVGTLQGGFGLTATAAAGLLGIMAENGILMGSLFGMNPTRPMSKMLEVFTRELQDFAFVRLGNGAKYDYTDARESPVGDRRLRVLVAISGFLIDSEDTVKPWRFLKNQPEVFAMRWEDAALTNLGSSLETVIKSTAWGSTKREIESKTIFKTLIESSWPEPLLRVSKIVDNAWSVGMVRAEKAGAVLADALIRHKFQGERPVSLIGYSLGARALYACLMILAERRQFGVIDSVVMIGAPVPSQSLVWLTLKSVVSGRLVNVYSEKDYILGFLYRTCNIHCGIAGLQKIQGAGKVENHCIKALPKGHLSYSSLIGQILKDIGWEDFDTKAFKAEYPPVPTRNGRYRR